MLPMHQPGSGPVMAGCSMFTGHMLWCLQRLASLQNCQLIHLPLVPHISIIEQGQHWAYWTGQSVTNLFFGPHIFSFDWSRLPSSYMTAVTSSWPTRNDRLHRGRHCILVTWYTINGKCRCFLAVAFMFLAWVMHFNFFMMLPWWKQNFVPIAQNPKTVSQSEPRLACGTVYPHSGAFWSTSGLGTTLGISKWRPKVSIRTLFGFLSFYLRRVLQRKMCHECIFLWHKCLSL